MVRDRPHLGSAARYRGPVALPTVILAAHHAPFRAGLRSALASSVTIAAEVESATGLDAVLRTVSADILLVDEQLAGGGAAAALRLASRPAAAIVFADAPDAELVCEEFHLGANGFLLKDTPPAEVRAAVRQAIAGEPVAAPAVLRAVLRELARQSAPLLASSGSEVVLTGREQQVAALLRRGQTTRAIAEKLGISPITVRRHVGSVQKKLGVSTRAEAARLLEA